MKYLSKIIEYGLYLLAFLLPMQTRLIINEGELNGGPWEYGTISLYATDILLFIVLLLFIIFAIYSWIAGQARNNKGEMSVRNNKIIWSLIGGLVLISAVSIFFALDKYLALYKLSWLILGVGLFWLITRANYNKLKLIYSFLAGVFLQAILGIWQFLTQSSFSNKWLGLATHDPAQLGTSVVEFIARDGIGERWLRAYGGLDHPNILGGVLAIGVLLIIFLFLNNKNNGLNIKYKKAIFYFLLFIFITALFFTFSRAAWLACFVGMFILLISFVIKRDLRSQKEMLISILLSSILIGVLFFQYNELAIARLGDDSRLEIKSRVERIASYHEAWQIIKKDPLVGVGLGNYTLALSREIPNQQSFYYQPTHNVFLLVCAETGILGFLFFIGLIMYLIILNSQLSIFKQFSINKFLKPTLEIRNWKLEIGKNKDVMSEIINLSVLAALIILLSLDHWLFSLHFGVLFFWLILGFLVSKEEKF